MIPIAQVMSERDELRANRQRELDLVASESSSREADMRREMEAMRVQLEAGKKEEKEQPASPDIQEENLRMRELEDMLSVKDAAVTAIQTENSELRAAVARATAEYNDSASAVNELRVELASRPSADEVKMLQEQVRTLRAVNMNYIDDDDIDFDENDDDDDDNEDGEGNGASVSDGKDEGDNNNNDDDASDGKVTKAGNDRKATADSASGSNVQLERLLLSKNRRLESELISIRNELHQSRANLDSSKRHGASMERIVSEQRRLIGQLEEEAVIQVQTAAVAGKAASSVARADGTSGDDAQGNADGDGGEGTTATSGAVTTIDDGNAPLIKALADQRDRARERLQKHEEEMANGAFSLAWRRVHVCVCVCVSISYPALREYTDEHVYLSRMCLSPVSFVCVCATPERKEYQRAKAEVKALKDDNVQLYEKLQYVQQYQHRPVVQASRHDDIESRYGKMYDERVSVESNPFEEFKGRERIVRQSKSLHYHDKIALSGVRLLLSNRVTRAGLMFYLGVLHLLVMFSLLRRHHACHETLTAAVRASAGSMGAGTHFP